MKAPQRASATPKAKPKPAPPLGRTINPAPDAKVYPAPAVAFKPQPQEPAPTVMEPPPVKFRAPAEAPAPKVYPAPPVAFKPAQPEAAPEPVNPALSEAATPDAAVSNNEAGSPPTVNSVKHSAAHTDLMRQIHANARDLDLPGSPAGQNGHAAISKAAKDIYGVNSLAELPYEKLLELNQGLLRLKAVPNAGNVAVPQGQ